MGIVTIFKQGRIRWVGHVQWMSENKALKKLSLEMCEGRGLRGRPRKRWTQDEEEDFGKLKVRIFRREAQMINEFGRDLFLRPELCSIGSSEEEVSK